MDIFEYSCHPDIIVNTLRTRLSFSNKEEIHLSCNLCTYRMNKEGNEVRDYSTSPFESSEKQFAEFCAKYKLLYKRITKPHPVSVKFLRDEEQNHTDYFELTIPPERAVEIMTKSGINGRARKERLRKSDFVKKFLPDVIKELKSIFDLRMREIGVKGEAENQYYIFINSDCVYMCGNKYYFADYGYKNVDSDTAGALAWAIGDELVERLKTTEGVKNIKLCFDEAVDSSLGCCLHISVTLGKSNATCQTGLKDW